MTARETALRLLGRVENKGAFVDRILTTPEVMSLSPRDRAFVRELLPGVLRWKLRLDRIIGFYYNKPLSDIEPIVRNTLRLGLFQFMFMNSVPDHAAVNESVELIKKKSGKGAAGLVNALLRRFSREGEPDEWPTDPAERYSYELSHPKWIVERWINSFGVERACSILRAGNERHPLFVRPGSVGIDVKALAKAINVAGFETVEVPGMSGYLEVLHGSGLFDTDIFKQGMFTVQDPSAGISTLLLDPQAGDSVLDLCAAPGGKSTHCAYLMGDTGRILALDRNESRLGLVQNAAERLCLKSITCMTGDALDFNSGSGKVYDRILLDAPCSGTGVFSKRPDMKWRLSHDDIQRLVKIQGELLAHAADLVRPGGTLVYSTCTLEHEENEDIVAEFLTRNDDFEIVSDNRFEHYRHECGYLILPMDMGGAGAFTSKMIKKS
ncbi:16S rRNA (cytosine(967)-C(5))-methyltransferase RsmB [Candidatus Latescibacterota bacterium]